MKKFLSLAFALLLSIGVSAQTPLTEAVDFTVTDCHGEEINLFEILDRGQYVLIDFYFYSCGPCNDACPLMVESYEAMGCNNHDIFYMEISPSDPDSYCKKWVKQYGVEYPTIGADGGGYEVDEAYQISGYPTIVVISPDRKIVIQDIFPVKTAEDIISKLVALGLEEHSCSGESLNEMTSNDFVVYPNPVSSEINIASNINGEAEINIYDMTGRCVKNVHVTDANNAVINVSDIEKGVYFINLNGKVEKFIKN